MSLVEKHPAAPPRRLGAQIGEKLAAAEQKVAELEASHADLVLDAELGKSGAVDQLAALEDKLRVATVDLDRLKLARSKAVERDRQTDAQARARLRRSQLAAMRAHAQARLADIEEFAAAIKAATEARNRFVQHTRKMRAAVPIGSSVTPDEPNDHEFLPVPSAGSIDVNDVRRWNGAHFAQIEQQLAQIEAKGL